MKQAKKIIAQSKVGEKSCLVVYPSLIKIDIGTCSLHVNVMEGTVATWLCA